MKIVIMVKVKKKPQSGMSLVELMVAMVIGLFLTAGVFTMFSMSSSNVTTTSQFNQLQENGRIALAIMERDISQLGFMGDMTGTPLTGVGLTIDNPISGIDCVGEGLNNQTLPNTQPANFRFLWGYESGGSKSLTCLASSNVRGNTDVIQIKRVIGPSVLAANSERYFILTDGTNEAIFFNDGLPSKAIAGARLWEYQQHVYFISNDSAGVPVLRRKTLTDTGMDNDEQLVEGIENLRILYGFDSNNDHTPDGFVPASSVTTAMWENGSELSTQRIVALKIYILVRSVQQDSSYKNDTQYILGDKIILAPQDNFRRKIMSVTVMLENPVLGGS